MAKRASLIPEFNQNLKPERYNALVMELPPLSNVSTTASVLPKLSDNQIDGTVPEIDCIEHDISGGNNNECEFDDEIENECKVTKLSDEKKGSNEDKGW